MLAATCRSGAVCARAFRMGRLEGAGSKKSGGRAVSASGVIRRRRPTTDSAFPAAGKENDMDDLSVRRPLQEGFAAVLPETLEEAERLAASIERAVQRETDSGVADLTVEVCPEGIRLRGRCETYYTKQLAQHAAMQVRREDHLINCIEVA
jgi:hypothetical protein